MNKGKRITELFTDLTSDYEQTMDRELRQFWGAGYGEFINWLVHHVPVEEGNVILDLATGTAAIPRALAHLEKTPKRIIGLDVTPAMLYEAKEAYERLDTDPAIDLVCASGTALPFSANKLDLLICAFGLHHMSVPDILKEAKRTLRPGGRIFLITAAVPGFWRSLLGNALLELLFLVYDMIGGRARAKAEKEALQNTYTESEWRANLLSSHLRNIDIVTHRAHRPWLPNGLIIQAIVE